MFLINRSSIKIMDECLILSLSYYWNFLNSTILLNQNVMKHNLILYEISFVEQYNATLVINVFDGYDFKCHYFQYVLIILLLLC
jgi:hypothetical protein